MLSPVRRVLVLSTMLAAVAASPAERAAGLLVDFAAVHADGSPVADLQASEVEIRLNGKTRKVRSLRRVAVPPATAAAGRLPAPYGTNAVATSGRSFALIVDEESFIGGNDQPLRNAIEGLLAELTPADRVAILALPHGGVRVPFTSDQAAIRQALGGLTGQGSRTETGSELAFRTRRFLESLAGFLNTQAGRSTPLTVVLFTAGLAAPRRDAPMTMAPGVNELRSDDFQRITVAAGAARSLFYVVLPADVGMRGGGSRENIAGVGFGGSDNPMEGIEHLAGVTGAARLPLDAMGTGSLLRVARETSAYYVAELEPEGGEVYGRSRQVAVKVTREGITVRTRPEMTFLEKAPPAAEPSSPLAAVLTSAETFPDLPLRVSGFTLRAAGGQLRVVVLAETADPAVSLASVGAVLLDGAGRVAAQWLPKDASNRPILGAMAAQAGTYRLRVAAIDTAGRAGAAEDLVDARLASAGPLSLGSLMLGIPRDGGTRLQLEFGAEPAVIASFDIYGPAGAGVSAALEVARELDGPALATLPATLARADAGRTVAAGTVPIGSLAPGDYVVRGVVRLEDGATGRVVRTLRKVAR